MTAALLGIDLGTSSVKVVLTDPAGTILAAAGAEYPVERPHPGWAETDPQSWWQAIAGATAQVLAAVPSTTPAGIGLSGQMHGVVLTDADGVPVRPAVLWADARATRELKVLQGLAPAVRSGLANPLSPGMAGPELGWLHRHEPDVITRARWALQPKDWIRARLTGRFAAEPSDASATLLYNVLTQDWDEDVVTALGIRRDLLPDLLAFAGTCAGPLLPRVADQLGLPHGIPVAAGAGDSAAAALGSGLFDIGAVQLTIGTGVQIVTPVAAPTGESTSAAAAPVTHLYRSATRDGWYAMAAGLTGGQSLDWVRRMLGVDWAQLYAAAGRQARVDDPIFLPHLIGERTPYMDTNLRGSWTHLSASHDREALLYSALEGVGFAIADALEALPGIPPGRRELRLAGGGTTTPVWQQLLADILDAHLHAVAVPGASARGAALLAGQAAGLVTDSQLMTAATPTTTLAAEPGRGRAVLTERRHLYLAALNALRTNTGALGAC